MSLLRTSAYLSASAAVVATALIAGTGTTSAALTTRCVGEAEGVSVPGDLVVPAGKSCALSGVAIAGSVRVQAGADLLLREGSTVGGDLRLAPDAYADLTDAALQGSVIASGPYGASIETTTVGGDVRIRPDDAFAGVPYVIAFIADIGGQVDARSGEVIVESSTVGAVTTRGTDLTDLIDSTVLGDVSIRESATGSVVCESEVYGDALFRQNAYGLQIGGDGALGFCDGASFWGGNLTIAQNQGDVVGIDVSNNIVAGILAGDGNTPAPTGAGNRVRSGASGQFADLQPAPDTAARVATATVESRAAVPPSRDQQADEQLTARRVTAEADAVAAGPAQL